VLSILFQKGNRCRFDDRASPREVLDDLRDAHVLGDFTQNDGADVVFGSQLFA
jgi:hypothetical protein